VDKFPVWSTGQVDVAREHVTRIECLLVIP
jgi:hypothetical protein